jgi:hypothetical protein
VVRVESKKLAWKNIGKLTEGKPVFDTAAASALLEGRVVFAVNQLRQDLAR